MKENGISKQFVFDLIPCLLKLDSLMRFDLSLNFLDIDALESLYSLIKVKQNILMLDIRKNPGISKKISGLIGIQLEENFRFFQKINEATKQEQISNKTLKAKEETNGKTPEFLGNLHDMTTKNGLSNGQHQIKDNTQFEKRIEKNQVINCSSQNKDSQTKKNR